MVFVHGSFGLFKRFAGKIKILRRSVLGFATFFFFLFNVILFYNSLQNMTAFIKFSV